LGKIHLVRKQTIEKFMAVHPFSNSAFRVWLAALKYARWHTPADISKTFASADLLGRGSNRVVFDISGNNYRMICKYVFGKAVVHLYICWIGTHEAYDSLCGSRQQYTCSHN
jgi:mRNA interferase HigB